jgi:hypothetical protein
MSNSGKVWDIREAYKQQRNNAWSRGDIGLGSSGTSANGTINKVQISTTGNAVGFGDILTAATANGGAMSGSQTRTIFGGGDQPSVSNVICYKEYSSDGNFADFGDLSTGRQILTSAGNATRGIFAGGRTGIGPTVPSNVIDAVSYASLGNATDFGDLTVARIGLSSMQSPTRGVFAGGGSPANVIDFITFSSAGNATDFGDLTGVTSKNYFGGSSTETKGVFGGGGAPGDPSTINILTIASAGNSEDFGDLTQSRVLMASAANGTRSVFFGGQQNVPGGPESNVIDYITIATTGNATDFGDVSGASSFSSGGTSNGHGGLELGGTQLPSVTYMPGSGRGFTNAGSTTGGAGGSTNTIEMIFVPTLGNALDFGDLTVARQLPASTNSITRSCVAGGETPSAQTNVIDCYEMQSLGNGSDFGDLTVTRRSFPGGGTNGTRGTFNGGNTPSVSNVIDYITIASVGNATDFGNLTVARDGPSTLSSPTRTVTGGGYAGGDSNVIDYITTASTGDATDFGDLTTARYQAAPVSSTTRGVWIAGYAPGRSDVMDYVTIASTGNATDFGDLAQARAAGAGISNNIRGVYSGGEVPGAATNQIEFITIATTGNSSDFGNLTTAKQYVTGTCDANSGLQSA